MASWLQGGRSALLEALNNVCDTIDEQVDAEIRAAEFLRKKHESDELVALKERVSNVDRLEEENRQLQATVRQLQRKTPGLATSTSASATPPLDIKSLQDENGKISLERLKTTPEDTRETLAQKNRLLVRKFQALDSNYKKVAPMYDVVKKKVKDRDVTIAALEAECEHLKRQLSVEKDIQEDDDGLPSLIRRPRASSHEPSSSLGHDPANGLSFSSDPGPDVAGDESGLVAPETVRIERHRANVPPSEATTVGSDPSEPELPPLPRAVPEETINIKDEPSSEEPIIISERRVRKRKADDDDELPTPKRHVKSENEDSGPSRVHDVPEPDSLDLDEVGPRLSTPRKLRPWADEPTSGPTTARRLDMSNRAQAARTPSTNPTRPAIESSVLTPVDANIRTRKPQTVAGKPKYRGSDLASGIRSLAEDGGNLYQRAVRRKTGTHLQETPGGSRLRSLLDSPGRTEEPAILRSAPPLRTQTSLGLPPRRELPYDKNGRSRTSEQTPSRAAKPTPERGVLTGGFKPRADLTAPSRQSRREEAPAPVPVHGALRRKDISELRIQDFKINPKTNGGLDYAYNEVVRGRAERACLPGCTDMHCCGPQFRALAKMEMGKRTAADDARLFEAYLGDAVSKINGLPPAEKDEMWLEAKAWELANKQGKHRARHTRRQSPPGFWDTGFPSTQEIALEKEEAARRERGVVRDRRREAMRPGGKWLFRDE
ncbi:DNA repair protein endonuclease SAE2/CtIP C-terminus-domain-containing protein [Plectosphaerella plurivora]|uniref:DNA repair protein endonuclease SAE2/CtIP C-terminus-domain-containing protein n=1 Tax=Plectosphaerella plurivora TaxID=936078 RepID=A0A9P9AI42_9PEZI|nr:DNA repair protein endonuclease SAE2/CtIP C-terminus-domain-containing protein [Plectosphaerella plurivora]